MSLLPAIASCSASTHPCVVNSVKYMKMWAPGATEPTTQASQHHFSGRIASLA